MDIRCIIEEIQTEHCLNCNYGKCLMALRDLSILESPGDINNKVSDKKPKQSGLKPAKVVKSSPVGVKVCNSCGKVKPLEGYPAHKECKDGHTGTCRDCTYARAKRHSKVDHIKPTKSIDSHGAPKPPLPFRCESCRCNFLTQAQLDSHNNAHHDGKVVSAKKYECDECARVFTTEEGLMDHMELRHTDA